MPKKKRICLGFGELDGICKQPAGSMWSDHWCQECDKKRIASISASLEQIEAALAQGSENRERGEKV